uniref:Uncharacterized protein n=1 Tax=Aegilops tauschii subsp. strangulata TaxID=200361 RepID=A0A452ZS41_AEGTS
DLALPEGGEEDDECGDGGKDGDSYSPSSSSASQVHEAIEDFFNVPDIDQTDSHREHPSESQRTPTLWPQRCELNRPPPLLPAPPSDNTTFSQLVLSFSVKLLA